MAPPCEGRVRVPLPPQGWPCISTGPGVLAERLGCVTLGAAPVVFHVEVVCQKPCLVGKLLQPPGHHKRHPNFLDEENFTLNGFKHSLSLKGLREFPFSLKTGSVSVIGELTFAAPSLLRVP